MDNKQYPPPDPYCMGYQGPNQAPYPGGYPPQGVGYPGQAPFPAMPGAPGYPQGGGFPQTGFAGPGGSYGAGVPPAMPMGFHMPMPEQPTHEPKPYSDGRDFGEFGGHGEGMDFSEKTIRMAFIRKVYGILSLQLLLTASIIALFCLHQGVKSWLHRTPMFSFACYGIAIVLMIAIACCESVRRKSPQNLILLGLFTLTYGVVVGTVSSMYNVDAVVIAAGITVVVCVGLTIFSFQTKWDFTAMGGILFVCLIVMFLFGILAMFIRLPIIHLILACVGACLFSVYLVYDTQLMMGGNHKYSISPEEYVFAALNIYMDIIMIFLYILRIVAAARD